jgi:hypothetical protein
MIYLLIINSVRYSLVERLLIDDFYCLFVEKPAIDRLLDFIWNEQARKPAIDQLIEEYLERIGSPCLDRYATPMSLTPLMSTMIEMNGISIQLSISHCVVAVDTESDHQSQIQTPNRALQHYVSAPAFYPTPTLTNTESSTCYDGQQAASTPLLR